MSFNQKLNEWNQTLYSKTEQSLTQQWRDSAAIITLGAPYQEKKKVENDVLHFHHNQNDKFRSKWTIKLKIVDCNFNNSWAQDTFLSFKAPLVWTGPSTARYVGDRLNCTVNYQHILVFHCKVINAFISAPYRRDPSLVPQLQKIPHVLRHPSIRVWDEVAFSSIRWPKRNTRRGVWKQETHHMKWAEKVHDWGAEKINAEYLFFS